ncbi:MAG TPA: DUF1684 domain-containing protein [Anaerolineae bacterium]|nr:DUF1684 domain-containing protein [Anaerolineae bacterium]
MSSCELFCRYSARAFLGTEPHYPYCAYDFEKWSCLYPPAENRLKVRLEAGEKNLETH